MSASLNDRLEQFFRERPGIWIDGLRLASVAGSYAWRSRCSDLRRKGLTIENKQQRLVNEQGKKYTRSFYRYVPVSLLDLVEQATG